MDLRKHPHLYSQYQEIRNKVEEVVSVVPRHPFGHAFLWGYVTLQQKNGKPKKVRTLLCSVCADNLERVRQLAESVPGVSGVWYNLD